MCSKFRLLLYDGEAKDEALDDPETIRADRDTALSATPARRELASVHYCMYTAP